MVWSGFAGSEDVSNTLHDDVVFACRIGLLLFLRILAHSRESGGQIWAEFPFREEPVECIPCDCNLWPGADSPLPSLDGLP